MGTAIYLSVSTTVGAGIFTSISEVAGASGSAIITILAFLCGWAVIWGNDTSAIAIVAVSTVQYFAFLLPMTALAIKIAAVALILAFMFLHTCSVEGGE